MKKRTIGLISALLAMLLLAGCGSVQKAAESIAEAVSGSSFSGARRSPDMVHFDDMEYVRPDLDALRADIAAAGEALDEGVPFLKTRRLLDSCFDDYYSYYTMYTLADIRSCQNLTDEYYAATLHEFFHATGHETRENRQLKNAQTIKSYAFEEMRAEMFSMLAGAHLALPMPETNSAAYIANWNQKFSDGDVKAVFQAASEAAKILTVLHQFESDEQPAARWFPRREAWPELVELQKQRDAACGVSFHAEETSGSQVFERLSRNSAFSEPLSFTEAAVAFKNTDNPVTKTRLILQNPDFLNLALKQDPDSVMELAALFDKMAHVLHMEMDDKLRSAPGALEHNAPLLEQQAASAQRMRI